MSNEVLPYISNDVVELFAMFDNDVLADVLRVWNCDTQDWHDGTTTVFRFENDDLLVWNEMGGLRAVRGAVDTTSFDYALLGEGTEQECCLAWRTDSSFAKLLGESSISSTLLESFV